jgi:hypothetical protein
VATERVGDFVGRSGRAPSQARSFPREGSNRPAPSMAKRKVSANDVFGERGAQPPGGVGKHDQAMGLE